MGQIAVIRRLRVANDYDGMAAEPRITNKTPKPDTMMHTTNTTSSSSLQASSRPEAL